MDEAYRTKLKHWLTSMLLLALFGLISVCYDWFAVIMPASSAHWNFDRLVYFLSNYLANLTVLFLLLAIWHFSDFIQYGSAQSRWPKVLDRYVFLVCAGCALAAATLLLQMPFLNDLGCPTTPPIAPGSAPDVPTPNFGCGYWTPEWKYWLTASALLAFVVLCAGKAVYSLASQVRRFTPSPRD